MNTVCTPSDNHIKWKQITTRTQQSSRVSASYCEKKKKKKGKTKSLSIRSGPITETHIYIPVASTMIGLFESKIMYHYRGLLRGKPTNQNKEQTASENTKLTPI